MSLPNNYVVLGKGGSFQIEKRFMGMMSIDGENWGAEERVSGRNSSIHYAAPIDSDVARINGHHQDLDHGTFRGILQGCEADTGTGVNAEYQDAPFFEVTIEFEQAKTTHEKYTEEKDCPKSPWKKPESIPEAIAVIEGRLPEMPVDYRTPSPELKEEPLDAIRRLRNEINCRIEHGAESGDHLNYVQDRLDQILKSTE